MPRYETREHDGGLVLQHDSTAHPHHDGPHYHCLDDSLQVMWEEDGIWLISIYEGTGTPPEIYEDRTI